MTLKQFILLFFMPSFSSFAQSELLSSDQKRHLAIERIIQDSKGKINKFYILEKFCPKITIDPCDVNYYVIIKFSDNTDSIRLQILNECNPIRERNIRSKQIEFYDKNREKIKNEKLPEWRPTLHTCTLKFYEIENDSIITFISSKDVLYNNKKANKKSLTLRFLASIYNDLNTP